ncbi:DUF6984 family protein [Luteibacter yeojuensis]|uniref:DUF6984 family protein n=1 Tax=Luteibacter yeojuensis TaxID=345309 RepID=UPI000AD8B7EB|nr:hypothetical protein [Luteibacter yeojuensis]
MIDMRRLTELERKALFALANAVGKDDEREQLMSDLEHCFVEEASPDGSRVVFHIDGYQRPPYRGQDAFRGKDHFPLEGTVKDSDGTDMDMAIYLDKNNRLLEFELVKHAVGPIGKPDWLSFGMK